MLDKSAWSLDGECLKAAALHEIRRLPQFLAQIETAFEPSWRVLAQIALPARAHTAPRSDCRFWVDCNTGTLYAFVTGVSLASASVRLKTTPRPLTPELRKKLRVKLLKPEKRKLGHYAIDNAWED